MHDSGRQDSGSIPTRERYMKPLGEMQRLFRAYPDAIARTQEIAEACRFSLDSLKYVYPEEITSEGRTPMEELTWLTREGARQLFGERIPANIEANIRHELAFIEQMNYPAYFLTVYDIVRFAASRASFVRAGDRPPIRRYVIAWDHLVDPTKFDLLFERFLSAARNEPPISMWTSSMNGGKRSCNMSTENMAGTAPPSSRRSPRSIRKARYTGCRESDGAVAGYGRPVGKIGLAIPRTAG